MTTADRPGSRWERVQAECHVIDLTELFQNVDTGTKPKRVQEAFESPCLTWTGKKADFFCASGGFRNRCPQQKEVEDKTWVQKYDFLKVNTGVQGEWHAGQIFTAKISEHDCELNNHLVSLLPSADLMFLDTVLVQVVDQANRSIYRVQRVALHPMGLVDDNDQTMRAKFDAWLSELYKPPILVSDGAELRHARLCLDAQAGRDARAVAVEWESGSRSTVDLGGPV